MNDSIAVLFVCLGNICRSPLAEAVFRETVRQAGLETRFEIDSAGTTAFHTGDAPDARTVAVAARRGLQLDHRARQVTAADLDRFHYIVAMDASNLGKLRSLAAEASACGNLHLMREFEAGAEPGADVPDPYFGGMDGFDDVHDMVERASAGLLRHIREAHGL